MKTIIRFYFVLLLLNSCDTKINANRIKPEPLPEAIETAFESEISEDFLLGTWQNIDDSVIDFILHLNIDDGVVVGEYCSKAKHFFFEDCAREDEGGYCSVRGRMEQLRITLETESCVTYEVGEAELFRTNDNIIWQLNTAPGKYAEKHLMPETMKMKKISKEPFF